METLLHTKAKYTRQLDSPFEVWFLYRPKVSANYSCSFGIGRSLVIFKYKYHKVYWVTALCDYALEVINYWPRIENEGTYL